MLPIPNALADLLGGATRLLAASAPAGDDGGTGTGLLLIAGLGVVSFVMGHITRRFVSEVIVFLAIGIIIGPEVVGLIDASALSSLEPVTALALGAIVFGIGERLELLVLRDLSARLTWIAVLENLATFVLVFVGLILVGVDIGIAYLLAAIALSTSPTTLIAVISGRRAKGAFTEHVLAATAINNVLSAVLYGLGLPLVLAAQGAGASQGLLAFVQLVVLSLAIGAAGAFSLRKWMHIAHRPGDRLLFLLVVLVGVVAVSRYSGAPVVISTLVMGALTANDPRDTRPLFATLKTLDAPIFLIFFVVAGAGVHLDELAGIGVTGLVLVMGRLVGKIAGAWGGAHATRAGRRSAWSYRLGLALQPFAGMAIGLAAFTLEKANEAGVGDLGSRVSALVLGSVVVFEIIGPIAVGRALDEVGDTGQDVEEEEEAANDAPHLVRHILMPISSLDMAKTKAPQVVDLAASTGAVLSGLHMLPPNATLDEDAPDPALSFVKQVASSRNVQFEGLVVRGDSIVDVIVNEVHNGAIDLVVLGEPAPRMLDRGGGRRIVHEVLDRLPPSVRVLVVPTVLPPGGRFGRATPGRAAAGEPATVTAAGTSETSG